MQNLKIRVDVETGRATTQINGVTKEFKDLDAAAKSVQKATHKVGQSAGLAGATLTSLGQGVGDIRYGFGAVANNISQVGSLFGTLVAQAGSTKGAFKELLASFKGPLGFLVVFQAAVAAIDYFTASTKKAKDEVDAMAKGLGAQQGAITKLKTYAEVVKQGDTATDEYKAALQELKKQGFDPATDSLDKFINKQIKYIKTRAKMAVIEDELTEQFIKVQENEAAQREVQKKIDDYETKIAEAKNRTLRERAQANLEVQKGKLAELKLEGEGLLSVMQDINNELAGVTKGNLKSTSTGGGKGKPEKEIPLFQDGDDDLLQMELDFDGDVEIDESNGLIDREGYDATQDYEYLNLVAKYDLMNMTKLEQINFEEQLRLQEIEGMVDHEDLKTKITEDAEAKRNEIKRIAQLEGAMMIADGLGAAARLATDAQGKQTAASKAIGTAGAIISTYVSASDAYQSQIALKTPDAPIRAALAASTAVMSGLARVKAINSVRVPHAGGSGGSVNTPSQGPQFDFNLVGQGNQTSNAIVGSIDQQGNQPIQAYVVQSDIDSASELNDNIINNVTLG